MTKLAGALLAGVVARLSRPDYRAFESQLRSSGYCAHPVRLRGSVAVCDGHGQRRQVWTTEGEPDAVLRKACGNRREAVCGPCADRYRNDAFQIIAAGLRGGKGVPESVIGHPALFVSLTAPSFGLVHAHRAGKDGQAQRCRPRRDRPVCPHGQPLFCNERHGPDDSCLGDPLCADCFDYEGAVIWNNLLGELWRRTPIYLARKLAAELGITQKRLHELVRVSYVKVAEYQHRGLVHLHVLIRLDRRMPAYRADELHPPADSRFTSQLLEDALRAATADVKVKVPDELGAGTVRWGEQLDVQQLGTYEQDRKFRAGYLAKYVTKSTETAGGVLHRITRDRLDSTVMSDHARRYAHTAFTLDDRAKDSIRVDGLATEPVERQRVPRPAAVTSLHPVELVQRVLVAMSSGETVTIRLKDRSEHIGQITRRTAEEGLVLDTGHAIAIDTVQAITTAPAPAPAPRRDRRDRRLAACAHTFGYRGHCMTKSRRWSTTFTVIRGERVRHVHEQILARSSDRAQRELAELDANAVIKAFEFVGVGHLTTADAYLAAQAAARARENRELAREALYTHNNHGGRDRCDRPQDQSRAAA